MPRSSSTSETCLREIILNPGGAARHYGHVQTPREETVKDEFTAGYTNVAYGKNAYQISTRSGKTASLANDGNMNQYWGTGLIQQQ